MKNLIFMFTSEVGVCSITISLYKGQIKTYEVFERNKSQFHAQQHDRLPTHLKMSGQSRIVELASAISKHTAVVAKYFESHGIPNPSFNKDYVEPKDLPTEIMAAKQVIVEATEELNVLALGPTAFLTATNVCILHLRGNGILT
jgi:formamidopyrimidine-DNA glycosylase